VRIIVHDRAKLLLYRIFVLAKAEPKSERKAKTPADLTPQIVKRVYELYEEPGREDVQAVEG